MQVSGTGHLHFSFRRFSMTIQEASEAYQIPMHILREYESWGLCGAVKKVMGQWQYDDTDLERLSTIMTLHDIALGDDHAIF